MARADEWRALVTQWKASGLTAGEFGARHGLSRKLLHNWAYRLGLTAASKRKTETPVVKAARSGGTDTSAVRLLRIVGRGNPAHAGEPKTERAAIRMTFAGATMDLDAGFDPAALRKILLVAQSIRDGGGR